MVAGPLSDKRPIMLLMRRRMYLNVVVTCVLVCWWVGGVVERGENGGRAGMTAVWKASKGWLGEPGELDD